MVKSVIEGILAAGGTAVQMLEGDALLINDEISASVVIARCKLTQGGRRRWKIRLEQSRQLDLAICVRMDAENAKPHDYYILPRMTLAESVMRLAEHNGLSLDAFRFDTLDGLFALTERVPIRRQAA